jgi:hypothetical protein
MSTIPQPPHSDHCLFARRIAHLTSDPRSVPHASPPNNGIPVPGILATSPGSGALPSPGLNEQGPTERLFPIHGVGVGISPQATSEAIEMPAGFGHMRRGSER